MVRAALAVKDARLREHVLTRVTENLRGDIETELLALGETFTPEEMNILTDWMRKAESRGAAPPRSATVMSTKIFGQHDEATIKQIETCLAAGGERAVLCADGHKGYAQPIGGVVAYKDKISLSGVGFDIACGNLAILTDATRAQVAPAMETIMDDVVADISFGVGRTSKTRIDHDLFDDPAWKLKPLQELKKTAAEQLGTVGGGNHYVDIFADEQDRIWVGVHFGSRGLGHKTATHFLRAAGGKDGMDVPPTVVSTDLGDRRRLPRSNGAGRALCVCRS